MYGDPSSSLDPWELQGRGARWQQWLDNPTDNSCPVRPSTLSLEYLAQNGWQIEMNGSFTAWQDPATPASHYPPTSVANVVSSFGLPTGPCYRRIDLRKATQQDDGSFVWNRHVIMVGRGVIFALISSRYDGPNWSDIALAVYRHFHTAPLRYVFRVDVINSDAHSLARYHLYGRGTGRQFTEGTPLAWRHGTAEYQALLGTVNGRGAAALVLGGFERGTKTIPEIYTFANPFQMLQMVLPIADIDASGGDPITDV